MPGLMQCWEWDQDFCMLSGPSVNSATSSVQGIEHFFGCRGNHFGILSLLKAVIGARDAIFKHLYLRDAPCGAVLLRLWEAKLRVFCFVSN